jgi:hypothetical protein
MENKSLTTKPVRADAIVGDIYMPHYFLLRGAHNTSGYKIKMGVLLEITGHTDIWRYRAPLQHTDRSIQYLLTP